jgi:HNH endonuclease
MVERTCSVAICDSLAHTRGRCAAHHQRWIKFGDELADKPIKRKNPGSLCSIEGCEKAARARGWCSRHYENWRRSGDPIPRSSLTLEERFWPKVVIPSSGCWVWVGARNHLGYGSVELPPDGGPRRARAAHRVGYELVVGPIPEGLELDHLCRYHSCVNPLHLQPVTHKVNMRRGVWTAPKFQRAKTHCPAGHPYSGDNLYINPRGSRVCRTCARIKQNEHERRRKSRGA